MLNTLWTGVRSWAIIVLALQNSVLILLMGRMHATVCQMEQCIVMEGITLMLANAGIVLVQ